MFTTNLKPHDSEYTKVVIQHMKELKNCGYTGFEFPIAPGESEDYLQEIENYTNLRCAMDDEGGSDVPIATNVGTTQRFDPSSHSPEVRKRRLEVS
jgi:hypothetical protein